MEKVWFRIILVHNNFFFKLFDVCLCNVLVRFFVVTIFTLPKVISSFIFYRYQFDVCLFSNVCQEYVFFFFQLSYDIFLVHRHVLTQ